MSWIQSASGTKIGPVIILIIVLLAVVFFVAALLHLLIRYIVKQRSANSHNYPQGSSSGAFQRQLQQLFELHDSGLDQAHIDALPVFLYRDIMGSKEPFDCAVCLCEFSEQDRLRLLPSCSHAFHIDCIDTWLLSNSSCPLCRGVIISNGFSCENPFFYFEDLKGSVEDGVGGGGGISGNLGDNSAVINEKRVFSVRLGKFKSCTNNTSNNIIITVNNAGGNQESEAGECSNLDARRCFSMGSFQYVVGELDLQVALCPSGRDRGRGGQNGNFTSDGINGGGGEADGKKINNRAKGESFSVSKIWLWSKKGKFPDLP